MSGVGGNAGPSAHSRLGGHQRSTMKAAQGLDKMPSQTQNVDIPMYSGNRNPLLEWFATPDAPWVAGLRSQGQGQVPPGNGFALPPTFQHYRTYAPSECSIISPSNVTDSGYGTGHRLSVGNPSVYGDIDRHTDTQSLVGQLDNVEIFTNFSNYAVDHGSQRIANVNNWGQAGEQPMPNTNNNNQAPENPHVCSECGQGCRTPSDLKKHVARHTKPHQCRVPNCPRTEGFSTANDLARHTRSRHPTKNAQGHFYKCNEGTCANSSKLWPRADNFRQHLMRRHRYPPNIDNIEEFVYSEPEPAAESSENGPVGLHVSNVGADPAAIQSLASRALGDLGGRNRRQADARMADSNSDFSHDVSSMVGVQFEMPPPGRSVSQVELHHPGDEQALRVGHEGTATPQTLFSVTRSEVLEPQLGDESIRSSALNRHVDAANSIPPVYQDEQPRSYHELFSSAAADPSGSGSLSAASEAEPDHGSFVDPDDDRQSEGQPIGHEDDEDLPGEDSNSDTNPEAASRPMPGTSLEETLPASRPHSVAIGAPKLVISRPGPDENDNATKPNPLELVKFLKESGVPYTVEKVLEELGWEKPRVPSAKPKKSPSGQGAAGGASVVCKVEGCDSSFQRECELRKHMKRHDRPYGCTFKSCTKRFGSKSDWKRHENSQHIPVDTWQCDEDARPIPGRDDDVQRCGKVCYRRETFKSHLQKDHGFDVSPSSADAARVNVKLESCRRGKGCEAAFWCGFCVLFIDPNGKEGRYDHIDAHLCGRDTPKRRFDEWKHEDSEVRSYLDPSPSVYRHSPSSVSTPTARSSSGGSGRCPTSSPSTEYSRDKRRPGINDEERSRGAKRTKVGGSSKDRLWFCCNCDYFNSVALHDTCGGEGENPDCTHARCPDCLVRAIGPNLLESA